MLSFGNEGDTPSVSADFGVAVGEPEISFTAATSAESEPPAVGIPVGEEPIIQAEGAIDVESAPPTQVKR